MASQQNGVSKNVLVLEAAAGLSRDDLIDRHDHLDRLGDVQSRFAKTDSGASRIKVAFPPNVDGEQLARDLNLRVVAPDVETTPIPDEACEVEQPTIDDHEIANGRRFANDHRDQAQYVPEWKRWVVFDGTRWRSDIENIEVTKLAKSTIDKLRAEALASGDIDMIRHARSSSTRGKLDAMIGLACSEPGMTVSPNELDRQPMILPCRNGTVDLKTGKLRAHDREDYATKALSIDYDPKAKCPLWQKFLERVQPKASVRGYLRRVAGYALTGDVGEHCLFFLYGVGANGKSVFVETIRTMLGAYGLKSAPDTLFRSRNEQHPTHIAHLYGARLVLCNEIEQNRALDEAKIKDLTGGDLVTARRMREDFWSYEPTYKIVLCGNHKPIVRGTDEGIWRRLRLVPWSEVIPANERDHSLTAKLRAELPGILAWAVRGCLEWQDGGLAEPKEVNDATKEFRAASDIIGTWINARCSLDPNARSFSSTLYRSFIDWAKSSGEREISQRQFGEQLALRTDVRRKHTEHGNAWVGISTNDDGGPHASA